MKITPYQYNANLLREHQRVIHQQNLKEFERLNRQADLRHKTECDKRVLKSNRVDIYV